MCFLKSFMCLHNTLNINVKKRIRWRDTFVGPNFIKKAVVNHRSFRTSECFINDRIVSSMNESREKQIIRMRFNDIFRYYIFYFFYPYRDYMREERPRGTIFLYKLSYILTCAMPMCVINTFRKQERLERLDTSIKGWIHFYAPNSNWIQFFLTRNKVTNVIEQ